MDKVRSAVVGVGHLGAIHARIYSELPETELVGICDLNRRRVKGVARQFSTRPHTDYRQLLNGVDCVSIAVPTSFHFEIAREFLRNGVNVLIEKPITTTVEEADKLLKLAKDRKLILQVGHIERFNAAVKILHEFCRRPRFIECHRLGPYKNRGNDVGVVLDLMIHDIDIVLALVNSPVEKLDAVGVSVLSDHEDLANVRVTFANGAVANLTVSRLTQKEMRKVRVFEDDAYHSLDCSTQSITGYRKRNGKIVKRRVRVRKEEPLTAEIRAFLECVRTGREPLVSGIEGKAALEIALEIVRKIKSQWIKK
jgi:predicted dehydrogenase